MATDRRGSPGMRLWALGVAFVLAAGLVGCGTGPLVGMVYTRVKLPLTRDLQATPVPAHPPGADAVIEIKEPFSGLGMYARVNSNALGQIARSNNIDPLYFADREVLNILGIFKSERVFLYGERRGETLPAQGGADPP